MNELTQQGIAALKAGDQAGARQKLVAAIRQDPNDLQAWLWLSGAVDNEQARIDCMRQVLRIDPGNTAAARGLAKMLEKSTRPPAKVEQASAEPGAFEQPASPPLPAEDLNHRLSQALQLGTKAAVAQPASPVELASPQHVPETEDKAAAESDNLATRSSHIIQESIHQPSTETGSELPISSQVATLPEDLQTYEQPARKAGPVPSPAVGELFYRPAPRVEITYANYDKRLIFTTRPSHVPALIAFWVFLFGAAYTSNLLKVDFKMAALFAIGLGLALEAVVMFTIMINFLTRYELTDQELHLHTLSFGGNGFSPASHDISIPLQDVYGAEAQQNFFQQILGIGDLQVDGVINGELGQVHLRSIPQVDNRMKQILYMANERKAAIA